MSPDRAESNRSAFAAAVVWLKEYAAFKGKCWYFTAAGVTGWGVDGADRSVLQERRSSCSVRGVSGVRGRGWTWSS